MVLVGLIQDQMLTLPQFVCRSIAPEATIR